jgi:hypothetical protein
MPTPHAGRGACGAERASTEKLPWSHLNQSPLSMRRQKAGKVPASMALRAAAKKSRRWWRLWSCRSTSASISWASSRWWTYCRVWLRHAWQPQPTTRGRGSIRIDGARRSSTCGEIGRGGGSESGEDPDVDDSDSATWSSCMFSSRADDDEDDDDDDDDDDDGDDENSEEEAADEEDEGPILRRLVSSSSSSSSSSSDEDRLLLALLL